MFNVLVNEAEVCTPPCAPWPSVEIILPLVLESEILIYEYTKEGHLLDSNKMK